MPRNMPLRVASQRAMRCGFDIYCAFSLEAEDNWRWVEEKGKCGDPAWNMSGDKSELSEITESQIRDGYEDVSVGSVKNWGHYCAEESLEGSVEKVLAFVRKHWR